MDTRTSANTAHKAAQLRVPAQLQYIASIRQLVLDFARDASLPQESIKDFALAVVEAVTNAVRHSNSPCITIDMSADADTVAIKVSDQGCGFTFRPERCEFPDAEALGGRGIPLMYALTDRFEVRSQPGEGTEVVLCMHSTTRPQQQPRAKAVNS